VEEPQSEGRPTTTWNAWMSQVLANAAGTLIAAGAIYLIAVVAGAVPQVPLATVTSVLTSLGSLMLGLVLGRALKRERATKARARRRAARRRDPSGLRRQRHEVATRAAILRADQAA
jgi:flagellar biosynthesis component FlhA